MRRGLGGSFSTGNLLPAYLAEDAEQEAVKQDLVVVPIKEEETKLERKAQDDGKVTEDQKKIALALTRLVPYVPDRVLYAMVGGLLYRDITKPYVEVFDMALLFVDMSGFTPLTERLSSLGAQGIEQLSFHLNGFFGKMIDVVKAHGGDVYKFAGDALMIGWCDKEVHDEKLKALLHQKNQPNKHKKEKDSSTHLATSRYRLSTNAKESCIEDEFNMVQKGAFRGLIRGRKTKKRHEGHGYNEPREDAKLFQQEPGANVFQYVPKTSQEIDEEEAAAANSKGAGARTLSSKLKPTSLVNPLKNPFFGFALGSGPTGIASKQKEAKQLKKLYKNLKNAQEVSEAKRAVVEQNASIQRSNSRLKLPGPIRARDDAIEICAQNRQRQSEDIDLSSVAYNASLPDLKTNKILRQAYSGGNIKFFDGMMSYPSRNKEEQPVLMGEIDEKDIEEEPEVVNKRAIMQEYVIRAIQCVLELHDKYNGFSPVPGIKLTLHSAVSAGTVCGIHAGGHKARREFLIKGVTVQDLESPAHQAKTNQVGLSQSAFEYVKDMIQWSPLAEDNCVLVHSIDEEYALTPTPVPSLLPDIEKSAEIIAKQYAAKTLNKHARSAVKDMIASETVYTGKKGKALKDQASEVEMLIAKRKEDQKKRKQRQAVMDKKMIMLQRKLRREVNHKTNKEMEEMAKQYEKEMALKKQEEEKVVEEVEEKENVVEDEVAAIDLVPPDMLFAGKLNGALGSYIPHPCLLKIANGQYGTSLAELRRISILFIMLPEQDFDTPSEQIRNQSLYELQTIYEAIQKITFENHGNVRQLITDDKGTVCILLFGLYGSQFSCCLNGIRAALGIVKGLSKFDVNVAIGVTTGPVYCGNVGYDHRCEYAVIGDRVNTSARLMCAVPNGKGILCDIASYETVTAEMSAEDLGFGFEARPPIKLKGKAEPQPIYMPTLHADLKTSISKKSFVHAMQLKLMIGRKAELELAKTRIKEHYKYSCGLMHMNLTRLGALIDSIAWKEDLTPDSDEYDPTDRFVSFITSFQKRVLMSKMKRKDDEELSFLTEEGEQNDEDQEEMLLNQTISIAQIGETTSKIDTGLGKDSEPKTSDNPYELRELVRKRLACGKRLYLQMLPVAIPSAHGVMLITGIKGSGKSLFMSKVVKQAERAQMSVLIGVANHNDRSPYECIRSIVLDLVHMIGKHVIRLQPSYAPVKETKKSSNQSGKTVPAPIDMNVLQFALSDIVPLSTNVDLYLLKDLCPDLSFHLANPANKRELLKVRQRRSEFDKDPNLRVLAIRKLVVDLFRLASLLSGMHTEENVKLEGKENTELSRQYDEYDSRVAMCNEKLKGNLAEMFGRDDPADEEYIDRIEEPEEVDLSKSFGASNGIIIVMEDWLSVDVNTRALLKKLLLTIPNLQLILTMKENRKMAGGHDGWWARILDHPETLHLHMSNFDKEEVENFILTEVQDAQIKHYKLTRDSAHPNIRNVLDIKMDDGKFVNRVMENVVNIVFDKTLGLPVFVDELMKMSCSKGYFSLEQGRVQFASAETIQQLNSQASQIDNVIANRIDNLPQTLQQLIKFCAVVGMTIPMRLMTDIYPESIATVRAKKIKEVQSEFQQLMELEFISLPEEQLNKITDESENDEVYFFNQQVICDIVYNRLLYSRRAQYHRLIVEWYESHYEDDLDPHITTIAGHWHQIVKSTDKAEEKLLALDKSLHLCNKIAENSLKVDSKEQAEVALRTALDLIELYTTEQRDERMTEELQLLAAYCPIAREIGVNNESLSLVESKYERMLVLVSTLDPESRLVFEARVGGLIAKIKMSPYPAKQAMFAKEGLTLEGGIQNTIPISEYNLRMESRLVQALFHIMYSSTNEVLVITKKMLMTDWNEEVYEVNYKLTGLHAGLYMFSLRALAFMQQGKITKALGALDQGFQVASRMKDGWHSEDDSLVVLTSVCAVCTLIYKCDTTYLAHHLSNNLPRKNRALQTDLNFFIINLYESLLNENRETVTNAASFKNAIDTCVDLATNHGRLLGPTLALYVCLILEEQQKFEQAAELAVIYSSRFIDTPAWEAEFEKDRKKKEDAELNSEKKSSKLVNLIMKTKKTPHSFKAGSTYYEALSDDEKCMLQPPSWSESLFISEFIRIQGLPWFEKGRHVLRFLQDQQNILAEFEKNEEEWRETGAAMPSFADDSDDEDENHENEDDNLDNAFSPWLKLGQKKKKIKEKIASLKAKVLATERHCLAFFYEAVNVAEQNKADGLILSALCSLCKALLLFQSKYLSTLDGVQQIFPNPHVYFGMLMGVMEKLATIQTKARAEVTKEDKYTKSLSEFSTLFLDEANNLIEQYIRLSQVE